MLKRLILIMLMVVTRPLWACTAVVMHYQHNTLSGRTFDWANGNAVYWSPKGLKKHALGIGKNQQARQWQSHFSSIEITMLKGKKANTAAVVDGINSQGLSVSVLELDAAHYPKTAKSTAAIGSAQWTAYVLDHFANVNQAVKGMAKVAVVASRYSGAKVPLHYFLVDAQGNRAVIEYTHGKMHVYKGVAMSIPVLTNTIYPQALEALQSSSRGGYHSQARFDRAVDYLEHLPKATSLNQAVSMLFDILADSAEPLGSAYPTTWTMIHNNTKQQIYWRSALNQHIQHLSIQELLHKKAGVVARIQG